VRRWGRAASAVLLVALVAGCTGGSGTPTARSSAVVVPLRPCPEQPARAARGSATLPGLSFSCAGGGSLDLRRAPGVPEVVNLWGSWCAPCRDELPILQQLADAAGEKVRVLGVISKDGLPQAASFAADAKVTFPSAVDGDGRLMAAAGLNALPVTYFLDAGGGVAFLQVGQVHSIAQLKSLVAAHLGVHL
jgi:cytochrome c biogenesis protein CcmG/thiol:disulfide interchange protein DsbE